MKTNRIPWRHGVITAILGTSLAVLVLLSAQGGISVAGVSAAPTPPGRTPVPRPAVIYRATGGPFVNEADVLAAAAALARGPVTRIEIQRVPYGEVVPLLRSRNYEFADTREIYVVAATGSWRGRGGLLQPQTCSSYFAVYDATTGQPMAVGCGGQGSWPDRLPPEFSKP
jgi:hypothetical protein